MIVTAQPSIVAGFTRNTGRWQDYTTFKNHQIKAKHRQRQIRSYMGGTRGKEQFSMIY